MPVACDVSFRQVRELTERRPVHDYMEEEVQFDNLRRRGTEAAHELFRVRLLSNPLR